MKTTIITAAKRAILIFTLLSGFQIQFVMAKSPDKSSNAKNTFDLTALAPVAPKEATFDDVLPEKAPSMVSLAPVTPEEATFDDDDSSVEIISRELLKEVAPVTPAEADFDDALIDVHHDTSAVTFIAPPEADFSDF